MLNSAARFLAPTAARFPEKVAVEDDQGTLTWRELEEAVVRSASAPRGRGHAPGKRENFFTCAVVKRGKLWYDNPTS